MTLEKRTSSSRIRAALAEGDVAVVADILGRPYSVTGQVVRGEENGRKLGFPTANLHFGRRQKATARRRDIFGFALLADGRPDRRFGKKPTLGELVEGTRGAYPRLSGGVLLWQ